MVQEVVLERLAGIKREYEELDTVWFMAGSLFKVIPLPTLHYEMKLKSMFHLGEIFAEDYGEKFADDSSNIGCLVI